MVTRAIETSAIRRVRIFQRLRALAAAPQMKPKGTLRAAAITQKVSKAAGNLWLSNRYAQAQSGARATEIPIMGANTSSANDATTAKADVDITELFVLANSPCVARANVRPNNSPIQSERGIGTLGAKHVIGAAQHFNADACREVCLRGGH